MLTCTVGLLSGVGKWDLISIRHPQIPRPWNPIRASGKGALGTWRSRVGQRRASEEPAFSDEPEGKPAMSGVDASQRLSFLMFGKTFRGKPGSEPYSGN